MFCMCRKKEILREGRPELGVQPEEAALDRLEAYHGLLYSAIR